MATRGGPAFRVPGNPLGGIIRDLDRRTRTPRKRAPARVEVPVEGPRGPRGPRGPAGPPGPPSHHVAAAAVVVTGDDGRARWQYPAPFDTAPVLTAAAMAIGGELPAIAVLEEVEAAYAVVRVWNYRPNPKTGVAWPVKAGVRVHVTACQAGG